MVQHGKYNQYFVMTVNGVQLLKTIFKKDLVIYLMKIITQSLLMCKYGSWSTLLQITLQRYPEGMKNK